MSADEEKDQKPAPRKSETPSRPKRRRHLVVILVLLSMLGGLLLYVRSDSFHEIVRRRVIAELESVTGGKAEVDSITWTLLSLKFEIRGLTIHGEEGPGQIPFLHADRLTAQARIVSFFSQRIGLRSLVIENPVVHLIVRPDGSTNQPARGLGGLEDRPLQALFDLDIGRIEINNGELVLNEKKLAFDLGGDRFAANLSYSKTDGAYSGNIAAADLAVRYQKKTPLHGSLETGFVIRPAQIEIKTLQFKTQRSSIEANGTIDNLARPAIGARYRATLDLRELAGLMNLPQLRGGRADVQGAGKYEAGGYRADGTLAVHEMAWQDAWIRLAGVELSSPFSIAPDRISFPQISTRALGGGAHGDLLIANLGEPVSGKAGKKTGAHGSANFRLEGIDLSRLAAAVSTPHMPLEKIKPVGVASGEIKLQWQNSLKNLEAETSLTSVPPGNVASGQVPVSAQMQAAWHRPSQTLDVARFNLATGGIRLTLAGSLGAGSAQLKTDFDATDLHEIRPLLIAAFPGTHIPVDVTGRARFSGAIYGKLASPSVRGHLDAANVDLSPEAGEHTYRFDSVLVDLNYTPSLLTASNGVLKRSATQINFEGSAGLNQGRFEENRGEISASLRLQNATAEDLAALAGIDSPISGQVNAGLKLTGTLHSLRGNGNVQAGKIVFHGEPFRSLRADIAFTGSEARFSNLVIQHDRAQITGSSAYDMTSRRWRVNLSGSGIEVAGFRHFLPQRLVADGQFDFHISGSGLPDRPALDGQVNFHHLMINGEAVGDLSAVAETHGPEMQLRARSSSQDAALTIDGRINLSGDLPCQFTIKFDRFDFDPLIPAYLPVKTTGHSSMEGSIDIHGPLRTPDKLTVDANIRQLSALVEGVKIQNNGPIRFSMANQVVRIDQLRLMGDSTDLSAQGELRLAGRRPLDVRINGQLNLKLLQKFYPNATSYGLATLALAVSGNWDQPRMLGTVDIKDAGFSILDLPNGLSQVNGRLTITEDRLKIDTLTAHTGGGVLNLGGFIEYRNTRYFDVTATGRDVRLRYPPGISASANATLRYTGTPQSSLFSGDIRVIRFAVDPQFDFAQYLARTRTSARPTQNPLLDNLRLDVHVMTTPELRVETSLAKFSGDADLRIRGTVANPVVLGRVNIAEGNISFNGTRYRLEHGDITFNNPQVIQPVINVEISSRTRGYDITIGFHGPLDKLSMTYRSDPPLPSGDIIALLAFGRTRQQDLYNNQSSQPLATSDAILSQALASGSNSRVQKLFGVGSVKIDPQQIGSADNSLGPRVTIEQQIKDNITLTYITNLSQSSQEQVIQAEISVTRSISIVAVRDQNGILGFDLRIKKRKK